MFAVDIGNSSTKIAVQATGGEHDRWSRETTISNEVDIDSALDLEVDTPFADWFISSVNQPRCDQLTGWIARRHPGHSVRLICETDVPLPSAVEYRQATGIDRLIAAWIATELNDASGPVIVIDAGTAVTIDVVDGEGLFRGGVIYAGASSMLKHLSDSTDALPDLSEPDYRRLGGDPARDVIGKSTRHAIVRGVIQSQLGALLHITGQCRAMDEVGTEAAIYATGGGIADFQNVLPEEWNLIPDLVLQGVLAIGRNLLAERQR